MSEKQIALVQKLAAEVRNPPAQDAHVPAPEGKVVVRGKVVSVKLVEGAYGVTTKMTVKVTTTDGAWLAWGTCPESLLEVAHRAQPGAAHEALRGREVEFSATLSRGRDAHFAIFKRPTKAVLLTPFAAPAPPVVCHLTNEHGERLCHLLGGVETAATNPRPPADAVSCRDCCNEHVRAEQARLKAAQAETIGRDMEAMGRTPAEIVKVLSLLK